MKWRPRFGWLFHNFEGFMNDAECVFQNCGEVWPLLKGKHLFISGGTGFIGKNLLDALLYANQQLSPRINICVLSRNPERFLHDYPRYDGLTGLTFSRGDVKDFTFPEGHFDYLFHAATETNKAKIALAPLTLLDTIIEGTRHMLEFAKISGAARFLLVSSGAVYGDTSGIFERVPESYLGTTENTDVKSVYAQGKRMAELLTKLYAQQDGYEPVIARGFAFTGKYLPLDQHFAIGNFIRDALQGNEILVQGDGTPRRSYLYDTDMVGWLLKLMVFGKAFETYNMGSDEAVSIAELAERVSQCFDWAPKVVIRQKANPDNPAAWYVPDIAKAKQLGLRAEINLSEAIRRTIEWNQNNECL